MRKPKLRFQGYTDDWEQRKVGEYYEFKNGLNKGKEFFGKGTPIVNFTDVFNNRGIFSGNLKGKVQLTSKEIENFNVKKGDIFFTRTSETIAEIGYPSVMLDVPESTVFSGFVLRGRCFLEDDPLEDLFKKYVFFTEAFRAEMLKKSSMTTRALTSGTAIKGMEFSHPSNKEEQQKIGAYFSTLDHLITLHQRKCEETKKLKKYMLQKMFPKKGMTVPEIRFDGFTDDWEQRKLGNILISLQNNTLSRADLSNEAGVAKNVHYGDVLIKFGEVLDVSKEKLPMISDESVLSKYKSSFLQNGDVIVADTAEDSTVGKCIEIAGLNDEVVLSGLHTIPYRPIEKFASGYLGYYLNSSAYHKQLLPLMQGIKVTSISKSAMQNTEIVYPKSVEEQGKIGNYFKSLDHLITLHQRKCEELQKLKKFMLQNMFV